ncbi:hypothetical protein Golax_003208, partial [Gossypium laxum]|nr:hypothetical protein [Gossypium laxum]
LFYREYGDLPYLLDVEVDKHIFRALAQYWNLAYSCFSFGKKSLRDLILVHPDVRKGVDIFALSIYRFVIFLKALGYVDNVVSNLFDLLDKRVTLILVILAKTFRSLTTCRRAGEGRFIEAIGYAPLLVLRQYRLRQFIPTIQGLAQCEFAYKVRDRKARLRKEEFTVREKDRKVRRGKDSARIRRRRPKVRSRENEKRKKKVEEDLDSLKTDYKKLHLSMRIVRSLQQYHSHNFVVELKASLTKIEELKGKIEELEPALQNCKL